MSSCLWDLALQVQFPHKVLPGQPRGVGSTISDLQKEGVLRLGHHIDIFTL